MSNVTTAKRELLQQQVPLTEWQRHLINHLQSDFPVTAQPFEELAARFNCSAEKIKATIAELIDTGVLTRFGPLFNLEPMGGCFSLCALKVPAECFERVAEQVNGYAEVAHNYQRQHEWNMWFVLAAPDREALNRCFDDIVTQTGCPGMNLPKQTEFFVGLHFDV